VAEGCDQTQEKTMPEVKFRHLDDEKWQEVRAIELPTGRVSVREKWLEFSDKCLSLYAKWDPGMMIHKHGHNSEHVVYVLGGSMTCGDVECTPGMHITLEKGATFGPFVAGPDGVELADIQEEVQRQEDAARPDPQQDEQQRPDAANLGGGHRLGGHEKLEVC